MASEKDNLEKWGFSIAIGLYFGVIVLDPNDIQQFYFTEDIFSLCMGGKMIFEDKFGIVEFGPFNGSERLMLAYGEKDHRRLLFDIVKIERIEMTSSNDSLKNTQIAIYFTDTTYKYFTKRKYSLSWVGKNSKTILEDILHRLCEGDKTNEKIILKRYDDTETLLSFIMPYWAPIHSILWLNKRTKPKHKEEIGNELGGYLYYNNTYWDGDTKQNPDNNFTAAWKSINSLFSYPISKKDSEWIDYKTFVFSGGPRDTNSTAPKNQENAELNADSPMYVNKILEWRYGGIDYSVGKRIAGAHMMSYNFDGKKFIDRTYKYSKKNDKENVNWGMADISTMLGADTLFPDISVRDADIILNGNPNEDQLDYTFFLNWLRTYSVQQVLDVYVRGWEGRFAGMMIKELIWDSMDKNTQFNDNMVGPYLIKSVTHNFGTKQGYTQKLILLKNAYYKSKNDSLVDATVKNIDSGGGVLKS
jgi:hypothetical protein